jgi:hypothetical protein
MGKKARRLKVGVVLLVAVLAFGAEASAAQAVEWNVGGKILKEGEKYELTCHKGKKEEKEVALTLTSTVLGSAIEISYGSASCTSWTIFNSEKQAYSTGVLTLGSPTVKKPTGCTASALVTGSLTGHAIEEPLLNPPKLGVHYQPVSGATWGSFEFSGASCPLAEAVVSVKGTNVAEVEPENVLKHEQPYEFSKPISEVTGSEFRLGTAIAVLTGVIEFDF